MIVSSLSSQEDYLKSADHLNNISQAYLDIVPEISHYYS